ncbi:hypothetical protein CS546_08915 [Porphyromonas gingivalis]|uniref:ORF6N domain-containing protein n=1 Tax=Porphyromonas gingivalis TaxID=837 RepID=UPI000C18CF60|nr:ORF6N domain-containing protein [Porphyromonas gingivalis]ATR95125.1 hypothetical protein CS546_08915 [Porphyromonas gingivalis]ATR96386.1 hypothetical protein CS548_04395 [Porphyromonas gingivalis]
MELQLIQNKIFEIRGQRVMLDYNLAELYEVETRALKQAVKRNIKRFPPDFMFELTKSEWQELITICDNLPQNLKFSPALAPKGGGFRFCELTPINPKINSVLQNHLTCLSAPIFRSHHKKKLKKYIITAVT